MPPRKQQFTAAAMKEAAQQALTERERTRESQQVLWDRQNPMTGEINPLWKPEDPPGYKLSYITERENGQLAADNLRMMSQIGWVPCTYEELGYRDPIHAMPGLEENSDGYWRVGGLLLCKLPVEIYEAYAIRAPVLMANERHSAFRGSALPRRDEEGRYHKADPEWMEEPEETIVVNRGASPKRGGFADD